RRGSGEHLRDDGGKQDQREEGPSVRMGPGGRHGFTRGTGGTQKPRKQSSCTSAWNGDTFTDLSRRRTHPLRRLQCFAREKRPCRLFGHGWSGRDELLSKQVYIHTRGYPARRRKGAWEEVDLVSRNLVRGTARTAERDRTQIRAA